MDDGINELRAKIDALQMNEPAIQDQYVYDPYDSDDSDQEASLLGEGSFGSTHTMKNSDDGRVYAVKLVKIKKTGVGVEKLREECARLSMLNHPNIVRYFTAFRFKKNKFFAIAMEYLPGGSLLARIEQASGPLTSSQRQREAQTAQWARQVASALAYMHGLRMQHRDLKPDNVLFDEHQNARVIDVGLAVVVVAKSKVSAAGGANKVGALMYQSPEKAQGRAYDGKDDVWALGCMLAGAVTGKLVEARSTGVFALDPEAVKALIDETNAASARFGCLVTTMLAKNPMVRPAAQGVEWALATGASVFEGGAAIVEEEEEDEDDEEEEAEQRRRAAEAEAARERRQRLAAEAEAKAAEERRQRLAAEAQAAEAERKLRAAEAAAEEKKRREAAAAAEAERRRRAAAAKAEEEKRRREAVPKLALVRTLEGHSKAVRRAASTLCSTFGMMSFIVGQERCGVSGRAARRFLL